MNVSTQATRRARKSLLVTGISFLGVTAVIMSGIVGMAHVATASDAKPIRDVLVERPVSLPDKDFNILVRTMEWPVGYKSKPHTHKGPGPRYVLSGKVRIDDQGDVAEYVAGDTFWHKGGFPHTAENIADTPTKVMIIELLPKS